MKHLQTISPTSTVDLGTLSSREDVARLLLELDLVEAQRRLEERQPLEDESSRIGRTALRCTWARDLREAARPTFRVRSSPR